MMRAVLTYATLALAPSLVFGFSNPNVALQGCVDLDCPSSDKANEAVCNMGMRVADAIIVQDILAVPESDTKLSVALTRSPGYLQNTTSLMQLTYDYSFWLIQPEDFNLTSTDDEDDDEGDVQVCGFFFQYLWSTFPMFPYGYNLVDDNDIVNDTFSYKETDDTTECPAAGLSETCMQSIEGLLIGINVSGNDTTGQCEAIAKQLEESIHNNANCHGTLTQRGITVKGRTLLGPGAPGHKNESAVGPGDDGFCFPKQEESDRFLLAQTLTTLDVAQEDDDGNDIVPDVPDPRADKAGGYLPLMTARIGGDGRMAEEVSFVCLRTLDQAYWAENAAGSLRSELLWRLGLGLGFVVVVGGL